MNYDANNLQPFINSNSINWGNLSSNTDKPFKQKEMTYWILAISVLILVIMRKRIVRFLRKLGLWKKAQEHKEKYPPYEPLPVEPEKPTDPLPEEPEFKEPTEENPVVTIVSIGKVYLKWLHKEGHTYRIQEKTGNSFIHVNPSAQGWKFNEYIDIHKYWGQEVLYRILGKDTDGKEYLVGYAEVTMPEKPIAKEPIPLPEPFTLPKLKVNKIEVEDNGKDQTVQFNSQLRQIPNGTKEKYSGIIFPTDKQILLEGDMKNNPRGYKNIVHQSGREFVILKGEGEEMVNFKTEAPAVDHNAHHNDHTYSQRKHLIFTRSNNVIHKNLTWEGGNTIKGVDIGTSPEFTPHWWKLGKISTGSVGDRALWHNGMEQEHAFAAEFCENIRYENCHAKNVFGDGFYTKNVNGAEYYNTSVHMAGRQSYAFTDNSRNIKLFHATATGCGRAAVDFEPDSGGGIDNVEIAYGNFDSHISAGGKGNVSNINIHDSKWRGGVAVKGHRKEISPGVYTIERRNWKFNNNEMYGSHGSPNYAIQFYNVTNVEATGNKFEVITTQGRLTNYFQNCAGELAIVGNDYVNPSIDIVRDPYPDTKIIWEGNTPGSVLVIIEKGITKEVRGLDHADPSLVKKLKEYKLI